MSKKGRDYVLFLNDILNAIKKIEMYTKDVWDTIKNNLSPFRKHIVGVLRSQEGEKQPDKT